MDIGQKDISAQQFKKKQILDLIRGVEDKCKNTHFTLKDQEHECHEIQFQNTEIQRINKRLDQDLELVQDHLRSLKKVNEMMRGKLESYSLISNRAVKVVV